MTASRTVADGPSPGGGPAAGLRVPRFSLDHMDRAIDPSVDFYRYAAGRWLDQNPVPSDKWRWAGFDELTERNHRLIKGLLDECRADAAAAPGSVRRLVGDLYGSAMDTARLEELRLLPLREELEGLSAITSLGDLVAALARLHTNGLRALFDVDVQPDDRDSSVYAVYLTQGGLSLPDRDYYLKEEFAPKVAAFEDHLVASFGLLGQDPERARALALSTLDLERELAKISRTRTELREVEKNYHKVEWADLPRTAPEVPWDRYFDAAGYPTIRYVVVGQPEFFEGLARLLAERPLPVWVEYLRWHLLRGSAPFLHDAVESADFEFFHKVLLGQATPEPRWLRAAHVQERLMGEAIGSLYVERFFPPEARARMRALVDDLCAVFRDRLSGLDWMTAATRDRALAKFARFSAKIGHPDTYRDYRSIVIDPKEYLANVRRAEAFEHRRQAVRVGGPVDRTEWLMYPSQVNAYFDRFKNEIVFPAGILQPPFFDLSMDDAVNFGAIGTVIAHEITHGFDDQGRKYDADGNLSEWWTEADAKAFEARADRVVAQYDRYEVLPGFRVNGRLTLGENIADFGGVSLAFEALERRLAADPSKRASVDGFTPEQRFFLSWAQIWRENVRDDARKLRLTVDPHSPGRERAIGPATNHPGFASAFSIPPEAPMGRPASERTQIW